jgi:outer membrane protein assembly factor BamB
MLSERKGPAADWVYQAVARREQCGQAVLPAFYPLAVTATVPGITRQGVPLMIFRSHLGVHAVDTETGKLAWEEESDWSLERMFRGSNKVEAIQQWRQRYTDDCRQSIVLENSVLGNLCADGQRVYAVEDLAVPPVSFKWWPDPTGRVLVGLDGEQEEHAKRLWGQRVSDAIHHNELWALDAESGKLLWLAGGMGEKGELMESFFLGPPLPLEGKLYLLNQKERDLRLACLDARRGKVEWVLRLGQTGQTLLEDFHRRIHAASVVHGDGVLVCPTNAGAVVGVDLASHGLAWSYVYGASQKPARPAAKAEKDDGWQVTAPIVAGGKVVFTAPDAAAVHCLNLRDGSLLWKAERREGDLYLAGVFGDIVLVVGREWCRGLRLRDGQRVWSLETGRSSGRGAAAGGLYYLPLESGVSSQGPEVCTLDVARGRIVARSRSPSGEVPGNVLIRDGLFISQTATELVAYPPLEVKLKEADEALARNPNDPVALARRGTYRFAQGDWPGAVADLRAARANKLPASGLPRVRRLLFEALGELLRSDFNAAQKYLKEFEQLSEGEVPPDGVTAGEREQVEAEQRQRRLTYYIIVGHGLEQQGKRVEALRAYLHLADLALATELLASPEKPALKVSPAAWARERIQAMLAQATPEQLKQLEGELRRRFKTGRENK